MDRQTRLLVELDRHEKRIRQEKDTLRERRDSSQRKENIAFNLDLDFGVKAGTSLAAVLSQWAWEQQGIRLIHALRTVRKLRVVAAAGILTDNDEELAYIRRLAASIK